MPSEAILAHAIAETVTPLEGAAPDLDPLIERIGDARFVLLGEATHGTHEFYRIRAELTKRLIRERGFSAIAAEADWPDAYRVNRYVRGAGTDTDAADSLGDFRRFPQWMWRNADILDLVGWLRAHNERVDKRVDARVDARVGVRGGDARQVGFYGLDVYSLHSSIEAVIGYLARTDPDAAEAARARYACFDTLAADPQIYGEATALGIREDCEAEVVAQLIELQRQRAELLRAGGPLGEDELFEAEQNARVVARAEEYYRSMYRGRVSTWNLRDTHMMDTLDALAAHLDRRGDRRGDLRGGGRAGASKIVVWAHNSHVGDASATQRDLRGELNIGQLCRQRHPGETFLVGFSTYQGTVTAASDWGDPAERKRVLPALPGSYEALFHRVGIPQFLLFTGDLGEAAGGLHEPRLQRAIGVVYRPQTERQSHYYHVQLPEQFDAVIHIDETRALEPLERSAGWERGELPETYPTGL
ncbi:MAG TPA: erythromycin esterase family protein [Kofleriaceae bacterium]|nr:erythromycin esterase family protein [Kofleriaceae bacterium]